MLHRRVVTFSSQVLSPLHIVHSLEGFSLLPRESLFIVIFAGATDAIEENTTGSGISEEVDYEANEGDQQGRAQA